MMWKSRWSARLSILATSPSYWLFTLCKDVGSYEQSVSRFSSNNHALSKVHRMSGRIALRKHLRFCAQKGRWQNRLEAGVHCSVGSFPILMPCFWSGTRLNSSDEDFGATCMHGPEECAGNVHQLCAQKYSPLANWWEFVNCNNYQGASQSLPDWLLLFVNCGMYPGRNQVIHYKCCLGLLSSSYVRRLAFRKQLKNALRLLR